MIELNEKQKAAAEVLNGVAAVVAVPGSGKTITMTHRIGNLVRHGASPESILGLTFTRNAAQAMRDRLKPVLGRKAGKVTLSTIHSFCHSLLRNEGRAFEILHGKDQVVFIRKVAAKCKVKNIPTGLILREIGLAKNNLISAAEFKTLYQGDEVMQVIAQVYATYDLHKQRNMLLDFNDLLVETHNLLKTNTEVREKYRQTYRHVLVDEFQDTNPAQMEILKLLAGNQNGRDSSFWICGDDWQSIYAFTGASIGNILNFDQAFPNGRQYVLDLNYRSTPQILAACQNLIHHNSRKIEKTLRTDNQGGDKVIVLTATNEEDEAVCVVNEIKDLNEARGFGHKDMAVLYRANSQSRVIEEAFSQYEIPYHIENGMNFYQRMEVKTLLDYLRLVISPDSDQGDEAFRCVINVPNRYIGRSFMSDLETHALRSRLHLYPALKSMRIEVPYVRKYVRDFIGLIDPLMKDAGKMEPAELIHILREALDYDRYVTDDDIPSPDDSRIENINQLQIAANRYKDVSSLLNYTDTFRDEISHDKDGVHLMTIHKAKGLEFPIVFVIGLVDGILPNKQGDIEEERRIAFVAMSRAMKVLYLSHSYNYLGRKVKRSPFLEETQVNQ
jgi:DNA helicase-2/ATP-dependent DNA helicase PcrA